MVIERLIKKLLFCNRRVILMRIDACVYVCILVHFLWRDTLLRSMDYIYIYIYMPENMIVFVIINEVSSKMCRQKYVLQISQVEFMNLDGGRGGGGSLREGQIRPKKSFEMYNFLGFSTKIWF